jgi:hypothetical protein
MSQHHIVVWVDKAFDDSHFKTQNWYRQSLQVEGYTEDEHLRTCPMCSDNGLSTKD